MTGAPRELISLPYHLPTPAYQALLIGLVPLSEEFGLILGGQSGAPRLNDSAPMRTLRPFLRRTDEVRDWPGSHSFAPVLRQVYSTSADSVAMLAGQTSSFWDFDAPNLGQDLHFLRTDGSTILGSTLCERHAYLEVDESERSIFSVRLSPYFALGGFDPYDEIDAWVAAYEQDLIAAGGVRRSDRSVDGRREMTLSVGPARHGAEFIARDAASAITVVLRNAVRPMELTVTASEELQSALAVFFDTISRAPEPLA
ncbi:MAG: hypothetical protein LBH76_07490 [Propionibacteriaceae bacterium]|jgi:hypothetical protein|nr:hypothetical protein [Propionibacteriaceae bacterium]